MRNRRIISAYDSINPSSGEKDKMLDAILAEGMLEGNSAGTGKKKAPIVYTAKAPQSRRRSNFTAIAAGIALLLVSGFGLSWLLDQKMSAPAYAEPTTSQSIPVEESAADHYAPILEKYSRAISEGWTKEQCEIEGISLRMQAGCDLTKAGYALLDLDGDGREELLIAEESTDRMDNIWDLYTMLDDGTPIQLWVDECSGEQCEIYEGNVISISESCNDRLELTFYELQSGQLAMREMLQWEDEDTVFHTDAEGNTRQVSAREGQAISCAYENQKLSLSWLAAIADSFRDTASIEQYTQVIEKYRTALTENWSWEQCDGADISRRTVYDTTNRNDLGWCLMDLDDNGAMELIVSDGLYIMDIYTLLEDGPVHLVCANEAVWMLCKNGLLKSLEVHQTVSGYSWRRWYSFSGVDLFEQAVMYYEPDQYFYGASDAELKTITHEEAGEILTDTDTAAMELSLSHFGEQDFETYSEANDYYEPLIEKYRQAIQEGWDPGECAGNGISLMVGYCGELYQNLGHIQMDLNGDGSQELIITDGNNIYDLYTVCHDESDGVLRMLTGTERQQYYLTTEDLIYCMGSGSASVSYYSLYELGQNTLIYREGYMLDYGADPEEPWYYYDGIDRGEKCPRAVAATAVDAIVFAQIPFVPFE